MYFRNNNKELKPAQGYPTCLASFQGPVRASRYKKDSLTRRNQSYRIQLRRIVKFLGHETLDIRNLYNLSITAKYVLAKVYGFSARFQCSQSMQDDYAAMLESLSQEVLHNASFT